MRHDLILKHGLVITPTGVIHGGIAIDGEEIVVVGATAELGSAKREIDIGGRIVFPGCFDPHIHLGFVGRDDETMVADFLHDTKDCLIGGVTTVATTTLISPHSLLDLFTSAVRCGTDHSWCDFKVTTVVSAREQIQELPAIAKQGGVSHKFFAGFAGEQAKALGMNPEGITTDFFNEVCEMFARCGPPTFPSIHVEEPLSVACLSIGCDAWDGRTY